MVCKLALMSYARAFASSSLDLEVQLFRSFIQLLSASPAIRKLSVPQCVVKWNLDNTGGGSKAVSNCVPDHTASHAGGLDSVISIVVSAVQCDSKVGGHILWPHCRL
jgi:hypothetical protein